MKKAVSLMLAILLVLGMAACGGQTEQTVTEGTEVPGAVATQAPAAEEPTTAAATEPSVIEANLFLKVSSVTFSLVGESEDIYLGLVPRELVSWESEDPSVVSVEGGVLTANGVGTTVIRATYADKMVECTAGCLAQTQEELEALDHAILSAPKRLPPEVNLEETCTYFENAALVGDSISYFLMQWEAKTDYLGGIVFLAKGGVSMHGFANRFKNIHYRGREMNLEDAISASEVERVYFLMGSNDLSSRNQRPHLFANWDTMMQRIREKSPDVEIVLMSNIPLYVSPYEPYPDECEVHNGRIREYNEKLKEYAEENGCLFLDLYYYVEDHQGYMPEIYSQGNYHMNEAGCLNWMKILRYYAQFELEGGTLS